MPTKQFFEHKVELTDAQIIERAHLIAKATAEINRIEEEKKQIPILRRGITNYSRQIENGYIEWTASGEFHWNTPSEGKVLITPVEEGEFEPFTREMTLQEKQEHSQLEIVFEKPEVEAEKPAKYKMKIFKTFEEERQYLLDKQYLNPYEYALSEIAERPKYRPEVIFCEAGTKIKWCKYGVYEVSYKEKSMRYARLVEVFETIPEAKDHADLLNSHAESKDPEDERDLADIFGTNEEENAPQNEYYIEPSNSKVFPWQITRRSDDDPFVKTAPMTYFRTKEEAEEYLAKMLTEKEAAK